MAVLPTSPAPSAITLDIVQPTAKSRSVNRGRSQSKSAGTFYFEITVSYRGLEFSERDAILAFAIDQSGRAGQFDVIVPTHSENNGVTNATGTSDAAYAIGVDTITIAGMVGDLAPMNLIRVNGKKATYVVVSANPTSLGKQQVRIKPPLREALTLGEVIITKNVSLNVSIDDDSTSCKTRGMESDITLKLIEEPM